TTVIDEEQLQRYRGQSVLDVLRGKAGFQIKQYGGDGSASNFYLRGYDSKSILVLIDGIRYGSVSYGGANLNLIPSDQIDRIEILHGASGASLYGADAMGGVIQIFTKGQNAQQSNVALTIGGGTENSYKGQITGQYVNNGTIFSLSTGYEKTDGIDATNSNAGLTNYPDKDGFESRNASLVLKHRLNDTLEVGLTGLYAKSTIDYDSSDIDYNDYPPVLKSKFVNTYA
ncbi:TonB-dependent receptor, partial [Salmonella enterica subsp. enterica]|nr:TonB-dependent receptor [Salmonella enterica subsp. enterica serovar Bovismorbificans]